MESVTKRFALSALAAAGLAFGAATAQAALVLLAPEDFQGTGLGAMNTVLTIDSPRNTTFESGAVAFGDLITGDAKTGTSQTQTLTLGELGVTSAADLLVVFNALEPGNAKNGITLDDLVLTIYSSDGTVLFTSGAFAPVNFADTHTGAGKSGFVFGLDAAQQAQAAAAFGAGFENNVVGLSAAAGCRTGSSEECLGATGGFETFFVASRLEATPSVPEPGMYVMLFAGIAVIGFVAGRRHLT